MLDLVLASGSSTLVEEKVTLLIIAPSSALDGVCKVSEMVEMVFCPNFSYV